MLERLMERAERNAAARAEARVREIEEELKAELPPGVTCEARRGGVAISARGLVRRYLTDAALRALLGKKW